MYINETRRLCFDVRCVSCVKQLLPGDEFALREDGLYCKLDFDAIEKKANAENNNTTNINHNEVKGERYFTTLHSQLEW